MAELLISLAVGAIVTWFFAWFYYVRAGRELTHEAAELRKLTILMLRGMEKAGLVKWNRDQSGNPIGLIFEHSFIASATGSASVEKKVIRAQAGENVMRQDADSAPATEQESVSETK